MPEKVAFQGSSLHFNTHFWVMLIVSILKVDRINKYYQENCTFIK